VLVCTTCRTVWFSKMVSALGGTVVGTAAQVPTRPSEVGGEAWAPDGAATVAMAAPEARARSSRLVAGMVDPPTETSGNVAGEFP
jgi:hypothetical protein